MNNEKNPICSLKGEFPKKEDRPKILSSDLFLIIIL